VKAGGSFIALGSLRCDPRLKYFAAWCRLLLTFDLRAAVE